MRLWKNSKLHSFALLGHIMIRKLDFLFWTIIYNQIYLIFLRKYSNVQRMFNWRYCCFVQHVIVGITVHRRLPEPLPTLKVSPVSCSAQSDYKQLSRIWNLNYQSVCSSKPNECNLLFCYSRLFTYVKFRVFLILIIRENLLKTLLTTMQWIIYRPLITDSKYPNSNRRYNKLLFKYDGALFGGLLKILLFAQTTNAHFIVPCSFIYEE